MDVRRQLILVTLTVGTLLLGLHLGTAWAQADEPPRTGRSWLTRNLERFFGGTDQQAENLDGRTREISEIYRRYAGRPIEVVLVHQVAGFREGWNQDQSTAKRLLTGMTSSIQSYTRDGIIRDYLLFAQGDRVDPFALADSEVLLRQLPYINDVRIQVVPLQGEGEAVAIIVETTDRWPLGVTGKLITAEKYSVDLYSENVGGLGIRLSNEILHDSFEDPDWGYRGELSKDNIGGSFWGAALEYESSYERRIQAARFERRLAHPGLHRVGGFSFDHAYEFSEGREPAKFDHFDAWVGDVIRVDHVQPRRVDTRAVLVPAVRFFRRSHYIRPRVEEDLNRNYHDRDVWLAGLTFQRFRIYSTSNLFGDGETENVPVGLSVQLSGGYEKAEFQERMPVALVGSWTALDSDGCVSRVALEAGSYWLHGRSEERAMKLGLGHITRLIGLGDQRMRLFGEVEYTLGRRRYPRDRIYLDNAHGIRNLEDRVVQGNQRLTTSLEARLFSNLRLWGFRLSFFGFSDVGVIGSEKSSSIFKEKAYLSTGLGVRLRNPSLVLPTIQVQLSFLSNIDTPGLALGVKVGNVKKREWTVPGTRPDLPKYN
jgi:hypothetical protein